MVNILLLEDDQSFGYIMKAYLEMNDFRALWIKEGRDVIGAIEKFPIELCMLDVMLPDMDGFQVARNIRTLYPDMPFIFLTAKSLKVDKLKGYKLGCDDYITKPVDEELLIAKIHAILNRSRKSKPTEPEFNELKIGRYLFDYYKQLLCYQNEKIPLTNKEARLLKLLCDYSGQLVKREEALKMIWGKNDPFNRKTMDVFIFKLRKYLKKDSDVRIRNVHGKGFILES